MNSDPKNHWEKVYESKGPEELSWTQEKPTTSLNFIHSFQLPKTAEIIDVGGGDSRLVDYLLNEGYQNISVLDISAQALEKTKKRLGKKAALVKWIVSDVTSFVPDTQYDLWHDRATFHFLTSSEQVSKYLETAGKAVRGYLSIGTFSEKGPDKCSGLPIKKYTEETLEEILRNEFKKIKCINEDHVTPFKTVQNFLFCSFKKSIA